MIGELQNFLKTTIYEESRLNDLLLYNNTVKRFLSTLKQTLLLSRDFEKSKFVYEAADLNSQSTHNQHKVGGDNQNTSNGLVELNNNTQGALENQIYATTQQDNADYEENPRLKKLYYDALKSKEHKRHFQVIYIFKNKIKRMYRIDCMTRKINV
jgi:hypothetical protein